MPAIVKNGTSSTAPVTVKNREFPELSESAVALNNKTVQLYAVDGSDDVFFYNGTVADTLSVTKVEDSLAKDLKLGYRYVSEDSAKVQTYVFNYLHGLALALSPYVGPPSTIPCRPSTLPDACIPRRGT